MILFFLISCVTKSISGAVYSIDGKPLQNANITIEELQATSKNDGLYSIDTVKLKKGNYSVKVTHDGFIFNEQELFITGSHVQIPAIVLTPIEQPSFPYLPINLDPSPPKTK